MLLDVAGICLSAPCAHLMHVQGQTSGKGAMKPLRTRHDEEEKIEEE